jgi:hypothetical protein
MKLARALAIFGSLVTAACSGTVTTATDRESPSATTASPSLSPTLLPSPSPSPSVSPIPTSSPTPFRVLDHARPVARETANGSYSIASLTVTVENPGALWIRVKARPNQSVTANWDIFCQSGDEFTSRGSSTEGRTPLLRRIHIPQRFPDSCDISALAQLGGSGSITLIFLAY